MLVYLQGMVEKWLLQVEEVMISSVRNVIKEGVDCYPQTPRNKWVLEWAGQVVLCVTSIFWTIEVAKAIREPGGLKVGLREYMVLEWAGQVVLCVTLIFWTIEVAKGIRELGGLKVGLREK